MDWSWSYLELGPLGPSRYHYYWVHGSKWKVTCHMINRKQCGEFNQTCGSVSGNGVCIYIYICIWLYMYISFMATLRRRMEKHLKFGGSLFSDKAMLVMLYPLHFIGKIMIPCRFQAVVPPFLVRHTALPANPRWRSAMQIFFRCL